MSDDYSRMVEQVQGIVENIPKAAVEDARKYLSERLANMDSKEIGECMDPVQPDFVATEDFLAGLRFAAQMVGDKDFDY